MSTHSTGSSSPASLKSLIYEPGDKPSLQVLDQLKIPHEKVYIHVPNTQTAWSVIRNMNIRGAPLIAIVAVLGLAVDLKNNTETIAELDEIETNQGVASCGDAIQTYLQTKMDYLATSRPTAVNLFNALAELKEAVEKAKTDDDSNEDAGSTTTTTPRERMVQAVVMHAEYMLERDVQDNQNIGKYGAEEILKHHALVPHGGNVDNDSNADDGDDSGDEEDGVTLMTICNTGSLATAHYGTALGVVRALRDRNRLKGIIALETRPYNQGSRLTAFELTEENMPGAKLISDSMAAAKMRTHKIDACVVGADRVCANGDTANKIGTYNLALVAAAHGVPFYVASPFTTLDTKLASGDEIEIEQRPGHEMRVSARAPESIDTWNPAFDVTPARYIKGIITEKGVLHPTPYGTFDVPGFVKEHTAMELSEGHQKTTVAPPLRVPPSYTEQSVSSLPSYLSKVAPKAMKALGTKFPNDLEAVEMGDGNLNLVFIVTNKNDPDKKIIVKQALPYVRCVGESWPLTLDRSYFEYTALVAQKKACPEFVPSLYHFSRTDGLIAMEYLAPPNIILRKGLIQGIRYPTMAADIGTFCAKTLFKTSGFHLTASEIRKNVEFWSRNSEMCALTEQVVFTEPYMDAPNNRWTSPQLDGDKKEIETDIELKAAAAKYKAKFVGETQALIHADLHSGSVMCSPAAGQTFVIDPEFAFYGPKAFDTGAFLANLFLAYVAQPGHNNGDDYADWILEQVVIFWNTFKTVFIELWDDEKAHKGFIYGRDMLAGPDAVKTAAQAVFIKDILTDTLGFAGMKMLRRIVGIAHVEDLDSIADADVRAKCERHGLTIAKHLIKNASSITSIDEAVEFARDQKKP